MHVHHFRPAALVFFSAYLGMLLPGSAQTTVVSFKALAWDKSKRGAVLDLDQFKETFRDDFNDLSVTAEDGPGPWFAPGHTPFGAGDFLPPGPDGPFGLKDGVLVLTARKTGDKWHSANLQTLNANGQGFAQQYGYFEMRAKFPPGAGGWCAFWLLSQNGYLDKSKTRTEIDIVEWYGGDPKGLHLTTHLWPATQKSEGPSLEKHVYAPQYYNLSKATPPVLENNALTGFHTYGAEITPEWIINYFDRREVARFPNVPEFNTPLYLLVTLAINRSEAEHAESPKEMEVDYVAAYQRK